MHLTPQEADKLTLHQAACVAQKRLARGSDCVIPGPPLRVILSLPATSIINKTDLAPLVGADLSVMDRDAFKMRSPRLSPPLFTNSSSRWNSSISRVASLRANDIVVFDAFTIPNSLNNAHPLGRVNSVINSLLEWKTVHFKPWVDCPDAFRGDYFEGTATIEVTATTPRTPASTCPPKAGNPGFRFVSDRASTTISHFAQIGRERNGVFFTDAAPGEDDD